MIKKVKSTLPWTFTNSDCKGKTFLERFTKKNCKYIHIYIYIYIYIRQKSINVMLNEKTTIVYLEAELIKKTYY